MLSVYDLFILDVGSRRSSLEGNFIYIFSFFFNRFSFFAENENCFFCKLKKRERVVVQN